MAKLTDKQENFAITYVVNSGNATKAYRECYDAENMKDTTIWVKAHEVVNSDKVSVRIEELRKASRMKTIMLLFISFSLYASQQDCANANIDFIKTYMQIKKHQTITKEQCKSIKLNIEKIIKNCNIDTKEKTIIQGQLNTFKNRCKASML